MVISGLVLENKIICDNTMYYCKLIMADIMQKISN